MDLGDGTVLQRDRRDEGSLVLSDASKAKRSLTQALSAATASKSFLQSECIDDSIDELLLHKLRQESEELVKGLKISLEILGRGYLDS